MDKAEVECDRQHATRSLEKFEAGWRWRLHDDDRAVYAGEGNEATPEWAKSKARDCWMNYSSAQRNSCRGIVGGTFDTVYPCPQNPYPITGYTFPSW